METSWLCLLLFITSSWAAKCPGSFQCEEREVSSAKSLYVYYGIIDENKFFESLLEDIDDVEIMIKISRYWPKKSDLSKNKTVLGATFIQCQFTETTSISDAVRRIFDHLNITKLKIDSSSFGDKLSSGFSDGYDSPITKEYLKDFTSLQEILLNDNDMLYVDDHFFEGFVNLKKVSFRNSGMTSIPPKILEPLLNLEDIDLSDNNFSILNSTLLWKNTKLKSFLMSNNDQFIPSFPGGFFKNLTNLKEINLVNSKIMQLTDDLFEGTTGLKKLDLSKNHLFYIPPKLFRDCKSLESLNLSSNYLSSDRFMSDKAFTALSSLKFLDLSHNRIKSLNSNLLAGLSSLQILDMSHNDMNAIDPRAFYSLNELQKADFSHNFLTLQSDKFMDEFGPISPFHFVQKSVQYINLAHNNITEIFRDWTWATNLRELDLSHNYINSLMASDLEFLSATELDLSSNKIEEINFGELEVRFNQYPSTRVKIDNNPLLCDCKTYNFLILLAEKVYSSHILEPSITEELNCDGKNNTEENFTCIRTNYAHITSGICPLRCACKIRPEDQSFLVDCSYRGLLKVPSNIEWIPGANLEVDLTGNYITSIQPDDLTGFNQITVLSFSDNKIYEIPTNMPFNSLKELYLDNNLISEVNSTVLDKLQASTVLKNLTLHDNQWKFDCESSNLFTFIQKMQSKIPELQKVTFGNVHISEISYNELCPMHFTWIITVLIVLVSLGIIISTLILLYNLYNYEIKVWLYARGSCLPLVTEEELDKNKIYDAFISFSYKDEEFIVTELVPRLEQEPNPLKICVNYHSWAGEEWVPQQISESVNVSRRTIIVLSPNYLDSVWGIIEFSAAHNQALNEERARVIIILYGDIQSSDITDPELKKFLKLNTCIKWGDRRFWDKLEYALPHCKNMKTKTKRGCEIYRPVLQTISEEKISIANSSIDSIEKSITDSYTYYV